MVVHSNATLDERLTDLDYLYHELVYSYSTPYKSKRSSPNTLKNINFMVNYTLELFSDLYQPHNINSTELKSYYNLHPAIPVCDVHTHTHTHTHTRTAIYSYNDIYYCTDIFLFRVCWMCLMKCCMKNKLKDGEN